MTRAVLASAALAVACAEGSANRGEDEASASVSAPVAAVSAPVASVSASASAPARTPPADRWGDKTMWEGTMAEENAYMLELVVFHHGISDSQRAAVAAVLEASNMASQGNPEVAVHAASVKACRDKNIAHDNPEHERICGGKYMAPLYDPDTETPAQARACIDQFEFPNIPCQYPVTWIRANEAVEICRAIGKRLCDAHEWESACEGKLTPISDNYNFSYAKFMKPDDAVKLMRDWQYGRMWKKQRWAYGDEYQTGICATGSKKSSTCGGGWEQCGANTYPAGMFPRCVSRLGVYDLHGNAAEHMNLPIQESELSTAPEQTYGHTEMKGSWFVFDTIRAHDDYCRWRAPYWHGGKVMSKSSHRNYHLGFRCCKSLP